MIAKAFLAVGLQSLLLVFLFSSTGCIVYSGPSPLSGIDSAGLATAM